MTKLPDAYLRKPQMSQQVRARKIESKNLHRRAPPPRLKVMSQTAEAGRTAAR